jgi:hypothetical protein
MGVLIDNKRIELNIQDVAFSRKSALLLKLRTLIAMFAKFIPIDAVESFVLFPFTGDYLNFFKRSMQIPIKIPTGSIQDKEIE